MALTAGFKKLLMLGAVTAVVGGGIYAYKQMPKAPTAPAEITAASAPTEQAPDAPAPVAVKGEVNEDTVRRSEPEVEQAPPPKKANTSVNRGLDAVLNAGKK
jgi:hypothetical protein